MDSWIQLFFIISIVNIAISYFFYKEIKLLKKLGVGKQGPPGPMGSKGDQGEPCMCKNKDKEYNVLLKDKDNNTLMKFNNIKHKPWADYIEEDE